MHFRSLQKPDHKGAVPIHRVRLSRRFPPRLRLDPFSQFLGILLKTFLGISPPYPDRGHHPLLHLTPSHPARQDKIRSLCRFRIEVKNHRSGPNSRLDRGGHRNPIALDRLKQTPKQPVVFPKILPVRPRLQQHPRRQSLPLLWINLMLWDKLWQMVVCILIKLVMHVWKSHTIQSLNDCLHKPLILHPHSHKSIHTQTLIHPRFSQS